MKIPASFNQPLETAYPKVYQSLSWLGRAIIALNLYFIFTGLYAKLLHPRDPNYLIKAAEQIPLLNLKLAVLAVAFVVGLFIVVREIQTRVHFSFFGWLALHFVNGGITSLSTLETRRGDISFWFHICLGYSLITILLYVFFCSAPKLRWWTNS